MPNRPIVLSVLVIFIDAWLAIIRRRPSFLCVCCARRRRETVTDKLDPSAGAGAAAAAADLFIRNADALCFNSNTSGPRARRRRCRCTTPLKIIILCTSLLIFTDTHQNARYTISYTDIYLL